MAAEACKKPHALVVPAPGQGHVNPCMLLARSLASLGFHISFVYFSSNYATLTAKKRLQQFHTDDLHEDQGPYSSPASGSIRVHVIDDAVAPGDIGKFFFVTTAMQENLCNLILQLREQDTPLTCLIADTCAFWTVHVAERAGIPFVNFWPSSAMTYLIIYGLSALFSQGIFPEKVNRDQKSTSHIPGLPPFSSELYPANVRFVDASAPIICWLNDVSSCGQQGERMLIHSMSEMEPDAFHALQTLGIHAYGIGSLLDDKKKQERSIASSSRAEEHLCPNCVSEVTAKLDCMAWLDTHVESSVIYIAFGTIASISVVDIQELAAGLEASGSPFLWVIREDLLGGAELSQVLPNGFLDRTRGKGMIISWAPQVEVLAHEAIGGFLSHCGWNSTLESLWEGVPLLCCPCLGDQFVDSHYLCNVWGVGVELARGQTGGMERRYVEEGVKGLMQEKEGVKARRKAQELMQVARETCQQGGKSFSNLQKFYEDMKELCCTNISSHDE